MIVGHQKQRDLLREQVQTGKIPHAFLFFGESQIGKKKVAQEFAKLINCQAKEKRPCQKCYSCRSIEKSQYPDVIILEPKNKEIEISQIRSIIVQVSLTPAQSQTKIVIIDRADDMNSEAQGALLKTLEEPRGNAIFILIAEYPESLSEAIRSRVQKIKFYPLAKKEVERFLLKKGVAKNKISIISFLCAGKPGLAFDLISNKDRLEQELQKGKDLINFLSQGSDLGMLFNYSKRISQEDKNISENTSLKVKKILEIWLWYLREFILMKLGVVSQFEMYPNIEAIIKKYPLEKLVKIITVIQKITLYLSNTNISAGLAMEMVMLEFN